MTLIVVEATLLFADLSYALITIEWLPLETDFVLYVYLHDVVELHVFITFPSKSIVIFLIPLSSLAFAFILKLFDIFVSFVGLDIVSVGGILSLLVVGVGDTVGVVEVAVFGSKLEISNSLTVRAKELLL